MIIISKHLQTPKTFWMSVVVAFPLIPGVSQNSPRESGDKVTIMAS